VNDLSLAVVELFQQLSDRTFPPDPIRLFGLLVGPSVRYRLDHLVRPFRNRERSRYSFETVWPKFLMIALVTYTGAYVLNLALRP